MLKLVILGLPRTATTRVYDIMCREAKKRWGALCIFEPTNFEVVDQIYKGIKHVHDVVGEIPYDYDKLPKSLFDAIHENARWHYEWVSRDHATTPFCGSQIFDILDALDELEHPIVIKDVHLWVYARVIASRYGRAEIIFTLRHFEPWLRSLQKRLRLVRVPWDKAGIGKFYRYYTNGTYIDRVDNEALYREAHFVYQRYLKEIEAAKRVRDVYVLHFVDQLPNEVVYRLAREVIR